MEEQLRPPLGLKHPKATKIGVAKRAAGCYWAVFDCCIQGSE